MIPRFGSAALARCQDEIERRPGARRPGSWRRPSRAIGALSLLAMAMAMLLPNLVLSGPVYPRVTRVDTWRVKNASSSTNYADRIVTREDNDSPAFEPTAANVSALEGQTVYLPCRVRNLGDKVVSWIRSKDLHILTSGSTAFSSDARFGPQHAPGSDAWTLRLDKAKRTDSGRYECQVNTEPKMMYVVLLAVRDPNSPEGNDEPRSQQTRISYESTAPLATIMGPREQRVSSGSTITLRCVVTSPYQTKPVRAVQWLRDNKLLTFQAARRGISVETEKGSAQTVSELTLADVTSEDVGKYSCRPTEGRMDTILLVVDEAERTEAMQRDAGFPTSRSVNARASFWIFFLVVAAPWSLRSIEFP